jgi:DNA-binding PadR family transcriptional regulator
MRKRNRPTSFHGVLVLDALARGAGYGFEIMQNTGLASGTVYPLLRRFEATGWVSSEWEDAEEGAADRRPPRRYYRLTDAGEAELARGVERLRVHRHVLDGASPPGTR